MLKRITINRVDSLSGGMILGGLLAFIGLFGGMFIGATMILDSGIQQGNGPGGSSFGVIIGAMILILAPLGCGLMGFIGGLLMTLIYNLLAGYLGGLVLEVQDDSDDDED